MKILVGMSGGVDSSTTAILLKEQGYDVVGVTMKIMGDYGIFNEIKEKLDKNTLNQTHSACLALNKEDEIKEAENIAKELDIDFHVIDCSRQYEEIVLKNFKEEYLKGRTPNPCIVCNSMIKFEVLPKLAQECGIFFDKFATGHYARLVENNGEYIVKKGLSSKKDQSYFLYRLNQKQLSNVLFPLGNFTKDEIRKKAEEYGLKVAQKPDSQDFYAGDYNDILKMDDKEGNIVNTDGKILGKHKGFWNYTIGQRKGLMISDKEPLYVIRLVPENNEVVVGYKDKTMNNKLIARNLSWISGNLKDKEIKCFAKIRSSQIPTPVKVKNNNDYIEVEFENMQTSITIGQSIVLYDDDILLGGGIIDEVLS